MLDMLLWDIEEWVTDACINAEPEQEQRLGNGQVSEDAIEKVTKTKPAADAVIQTRGGKMTMSSLQATAHSSRREDAKIRASAAADGRQDL